MNERHKTVLNQFRHTKTGGDPLCLRPAPIFFRTSRAGFDQLFDLKRRKSIIFIITRLFLSPPTRALPSNILIYS